MVNRFDPATGGTLPDREQRLLARRRAVMGDLYPLFYDVPVHVVSGVGARLFDADGIEYLDAYNNVPAVGHANPRVAEAVERQLRTLNTHTRYLEESVVAYSERFLGTFPPHLDRVIYSNSGSEANDLAVRLAQWRTGKQGVIVTRNAYHGTTALLAGMSPENGSNMPLHPFVRMVDHPDVYRRGTGEGEAFAERVQQAMWDLHRHGFGTAALLVDTIMSTDGIVPGPAGVLAPAFATVRESGAMVIADEVQPGMGRTGSGWWGFQAHTDAVDIVTCGKPLAGGMPMGTLVLSGELSDAYASHARYFNTFGGNPATIAAATAVLDEIEERDLIGSTRRVGDYLMHGIRAAAAGDTRIGDIRGAGLFIGVEFVSDPVERTPDGRTARGVVSALRERQVLISAVGAQGQVLKIRPPLVFTRADAAWFLEAFAQSLMATRAEAA